MKHLHRSLVLAIAGLALTSSVFAQSSTDAGAMKPTDGMPSTKAAGAQSEGSQQLHKIMMHSTKQPMPPMTGDVDKDFAALMVMHHEQAIQMADVLLKYGHDEKLKAMTRKMQADQREEIQQLSGFTH